MIVLLLVITAASLAVTAPREKPSPDAEATRLIDALKNKDLSTVTEVMTHLSRSPLGNIEPKATLTPECVKKYTDGLTTMAGKDYVPDRQIVFCWTMVQLPFAILGSAMGGGSGDCLIPLLLRTTHLLDRPGMRCPGAETKFLDSACELHGMYKIDLAFCK